VMSRRVECNTIISCLEDRSLLTCCATALCGRFFLKPPSDFVIQPSAAHVRKTINSTSFYIGDNICNMVCDLDL